MGTEGLRATEDIIALEALINLAMEIIIYMVDLVVSMVRIESLADMVNIGHITDGFGQNSHRLMN
jgi:hypothetical protein